MEKMADHASTKTVTLVKIKEVLSKEHKKSTEETYDIYLLPPGEDPEACQSYLRMRNMDGKYTLMFEEDCFYDLAYNTGYQISVLRLGKTRDEIMKCTLSIYVDIYFD